MIKTLTEQYKSLRSRYRHRLPEGMYLKLTYQERTGKPLNLSHPMTFGDKLQWLKLNYRPSHLVQLVDKFLVREHIAKTVGEQYLIPNYNVYDRVEDIDPNTLPHSFIIKPNHGSGWFIRCPDKAKLNWPDAREKLTSWMSQNYSTKGREWPYAYVPRKILCQHLLQPEPGEPLVEYQLFCTDGVLRFCQADLGPMDARVRYFYDANWKKMDVRHRYRTEADELDRPWQWDQMLDIASKLSKGLPFVRVDLYNLNKHIYFGELTLYPGAGYNQYEPESFNSTIGQWITLPKRCRQDKLCQLATSGTGR